MTTLIEVWGNRILSNSILPMPKKFDVRITADKIGKSMSITDNDMGVMFQIPLEAVEKVLKEALNEQISNGI